MEGGLVNVVVQHDVGGANGTFERGRVEVVLLLLGDLLTGKVFGKRAWRTGPQNRRGGEAFNRSRHGGSVELGRNGVRSLGQADGRYVRSAAGRS